jgi:hypothetical protein
MDTFDYDAHKKKLRWMWFFGIGIVWILWIIGKANDAYNAAQAEVDQKTGFDHWWHSSHFMMNGDADNARMSWFGGGFFGLIGVWIVAHFIAVSMADAKKAAIARNQEAQANRQQQDFQQQMEDINEQNTKDANLSKAAQSKQELIMRLGTIDQYIRVLGVEKDTGQRTVALQAAHSEITTLAAKLSSGQISREVLDDPDIRAQASETSQDLASVGLSNDRLNRDLIRIFKLNGNAST